MYENSEESAKTSNDPSHLLPQPKKNHWKSEIISHRLIIAMFFFMLYAVMRYWKRTNRVTRKYNFNANASTAVTLITKAWTIPSTVNVIRLTPRLKTLANRRQSTTISMWHRFTLRSWNRKEPPPMTWSMLSATIHPRRKNKIYLCLAVETLPLSVSLIAHQRSIIFPMTSLSAFQNKCRFIFSFKILSYI